ncbi:unnamed protein product [Rotaria sp. Silwood2]|nr:unnamed protein product [Rotaria sp. Silwood2]
MVTFIYLFCSENPKLYVETIFNIHTKFFKIAKEHYTSENNFTAALDQACHKFINNNAVTKAAGKTAKSPELLARYCDGLLRKGKMLAKRLVGQLSASNNDEESMISKLKQACGVAYTSKLQRMFQDIGVSKNLIDQYRTYCENNKLDDIVDFSVMVLSSNSWPFSTLLNVVLPIELKRTFESFTKYYTQQHNGRTLIWLYQHSQGDLQTLYTKQKTYSKFLLLFNKLSSWTVERMQDETQIKVDLFLQVLCGLLKSKLITCPEINDGELDKDLKETDIKMSSNIQIADDFKRSVCSTNHLIKNL